MPNLGENARGAGVARDQVLASDRWMTDVFHPQARAVSAFFLHCDRPKVDGLDSEKIDLAYFR
jgi:hypothetical protein